MLPLSNDDEGGLTIVARHQTVNFWHWAFLSFHGLSAVLCWACFALLWIRSKGTLFHRRLGKFLFFAFLLPLELSGLWLIPGLFVSRKNIMLNVGAWVVPSMGWLFAITTYDTFQFRLYKSSNGVHQFVHLARQVTLVAQWIGSLYLATQVVLNWSRHHQDESDHKDLCLELFFLTFPFTLIETFVQSHELGHKMTHGFFGTYLTLQLFPGSLIVITHDKHWLFGPHGIKDVSTKILLEAVCMIPFTWKTIHWIARVHKQQQQVISTRDTLGKDKKTSSRTRPNNLYRGLVSIVVVAIFLAFRAELPQMSSSSSSTRQTSNKTKRTRL